jgi:fructose-1,6-bisphosphatase/inositol monophosphatase family enzyme
MHQERIDFIKNLAIEAGKLTLEGYGKSGQIPKNVQDGYDITTEYDLRAEELVKRRILDEFGEPVLGEEDGLIGDRELAKQRLWIVDPIDGTFNYQRGVPLYGVSIAYCEEGVPVGGAIYLPVLEQLFYAGHGRGAFLVEGDLHSPMPIQVSPKQELPRLVISMAGRDVYQLLAGCDKEGIPRRTLRLLMSAVLSLAYIAYGRMDAYLHTALNLWDCAAGDVLLREAGGPPACDFRGVPIFPEYVNRLVEGNEQNSFTFVAVSSRDLLEEPFKRVIRAAGFQVER